jgi:hypothetical protein
VVVYDQRPPGRGALVAGGERDYLVTTLAAERAAKLAEDAVSNAPVKDVFRNAG